MSKSQCKLCNQPATRRSLCGSHYKKACRAGTIEQYPKINISIPELFWQKVDKTVGHGPFGTCWMWKASTTQGGYGSAWDGQKGRRAHRLSYLWAKGPFDESLDVLHKCDEPACVNPEHLFLGTDTDNARDKVAKGRAKTCPGSLHPKTHLTESDILMIREIYKAGGISQMAIGEMYGIGQTAVTKIILRKTWRHI